MASITANRTVSPTLSWAGRMPLLQQIFVLTWRSLLIQFRIPEGFVTTLIIGGFFILVYDGAFGGAANFLPGLIGVDYIAFTLPISIISAALGGAAGQAMVRDIESGYFDKLLLTPVSRGALLMGHILSGAIALVLQTLLIMGLAVLLGLESATGVGGFAVNIAFALIVGLGFSGFTVGIALLTGSATVTQSASFAFFPLTFLTSTFVPVTLLTGWIKTAATLNPITYVLDAMRSVLIQGWEPQVLLAGLGSALLLGALPFLFAVWSLRVRTRGR